MVRKYRVLVVGDHSNPAGPTESQWAELEVPDGISTDDAFTRYALPAAMAAWIGYRERETMAEAVNEAAK